uniref:Integrating conjugative element n=5 Tax=Pseudomonas aeruginosa group TaxID=136841 RepID=A0A6H0JJM6_PSEAI|nr:integrating conjugative element [Pseudomonas aeruginosa]
MRALNSLTQNLIDNLTQILQNPEEDALQTLRICAPVLIEELQQIQLRAVDRRDIVPQGSVAKIVKLEHACSSFTIFATEPLEEQLTDALPKDPQQAQVAFQQLLQSPEGRRLQAELVKAQQDVTDAWSLGVEKIPAVVVDRQYVVYGEPDVPRALELIAKARRTR